MKVDCQPFPQANEVELSDFGSEGQNLAFQINMAGLKGSPACPTLEGEGVNRVANRFLT